MAQVIKCECGVIVRGSDDRELIANAEKHIAADHPQLVGRYSPEQLAGMAEQL
jgi:hypothetical protein